MESFNYIASRFFILLVLLLAPVLSHGACGVSGNILTVASPYEESDFVDCYNTASSLTGEVTINIPDTGGVVAWTAITMNMQSGFANVTKLKVVGAGQDTTEIGFSSAQSITFTFDADVAFEWWDTTFTSSVADFWQIQGNPRDVRISGNEFDSTGRVARILGDYEQSVLIDNNYHHGSSQVGWFVESDNGDNGWQGALALGTSQAVYFEDNTFSRDVSGWVDGQPAIDCKQGGRFVARGNTFENIMVAIHGTDSPSTVSCLSYEIYDNEFYGHTVNSGAGPYRAIFIRGGTGVIYDNDFTGAWQKKMDMTYYCACDYFCGWDYCTTYPCREQPGRAGVSQTLYPLFEWGNLLDESDDIDFTVYDFSGSTCYVDNPPETGQPSTFLLENQDFYNDTEPGDEGYSYTAYTYPHPLRGKSLNFNQSGTTNFNQAGSLNFNQ